jgi:hypothetical protein
MSINDNKLLFISSAHSKTNKFMLKALNDAALYSETL